MTNVPMMLSGKAIFPIVFITCFKIQNLDAFSCRVIINIESRVASLKGQRDVFLVPVPKFLIGQPLKKLNWWRR